MARTAPPPAIPEAVVLRQCLEFLRLQGAQPMRRNVGGMFNAAGDYVKFNDPGSADISATFNGRRIEVEVKRTGYRPQGKRDRRHFADQIAWLNTINAAGGVGIVVDRLEWLERLWSAITAGADFQVSADGTVEVSLIPKGGVSC